ncbi:hypothetical protein BCR35DRAFT_298989 [Leucosporidium creatinivorum]|uniref:SET domain-containing protein n=1 Tax=Leucosporidium creatinivorum TaxID=106004 RepID=A0A1Y2G2U5_9BASI|nr:hypothetical protein BCR35DRAFT_298989 [Leucosporidium creatinivorum]
MKRGFFGGKSSTPAQPKPKPAAAQPTTTPAAGATPIPPLASAPPGWASSPRDSPSTLHWTFLPTSPTPTPSSPTASTALLLTATSRALLASRPPPPLLGSANNSPAYEIRSTPKKGLALFAKRDLPPNSPVLVDRPLLVYDSSDRGPSRKEANAIFTHALSHLDPEHQRQFLELSNCFAGSDTIFGRVETNGAPVISFEGAGNAADPVTYTGVFPLYSRINHACDANARPEWDWERFELGVRTTRAVKAGEELCVTYIVPFQKRRERREELLVKWRFECQCSWCSLSDEESAKRDIEREKMAEAFMKQWHAQVGEDVRS